MSIFFLFFSLPQSPRGKASSQRAGDQWFSPCSSHIRRPVIGSLFQSHQETSGWFSPCSSHTRRPVVGSPLVPVTPGDQWLVLPLFQSHQETSGWFLVPVTPGDQWLVLPLFQSHEPPEKKGAPVVTLPDVWHHKITANAERHSASIL